MVSISGMKMKNLVFTISLVILTATNILAQIDPHGHLDTLYLDTITVGLGREFVYNVNLWNDEELGGVTVPLKYPVDKLDFVELSFSGSRVEYLSSLYSTVDQGDGTILAGILVVEEDYIPPGDGKVFSLIFRLKETAVPGEIFYLDSLTIPPVAQLMLTDFAAQSIYPAFDRGEIRVSTENQPPYFKPISDRYSMEGDSIYIQVKAIDFEGDNITLTNPIHPHSSDFIDNGDGTGLFSWRSDFIGPNSSDQSPFTFVFTATDGDKSSNLHVKVNVINVNRKPQILAPELIEAEAGDSLGISVSAADPDFEEITWSVLDLPPGAEFDYQNPGFINWKTQFSDSGDYTISLIASDLYGKADTAFIDLKLAPVTFFCLRIDTLTTFAGKIVGLDVMLKNKLKVKELDLLVNLDPAILTPLEVSRVGSRIADFDYFNYTINAAGNPGDLRITARAGNGTLLEVGEGVICRISIQVSSNLIFVGNRVPVVFMTRTFGDNSVTDENNVIYFNEEVNLFNGFIRISSPGVSLLGDINLNGIAYEIGDAVYFSNHFINPIEYPLNEQQLINSDINQDGFAPSVADLVLLIKIVSGGADPLWIKALENESLADVELIRRVDGLYLQVETPVALGGAMFKFTGNDVSLVGTENLTEMNLMSHARGDMSLSYLFISYEDKVISSGSANLLKLSDNPDLDVELVQIDLADADGRVVNVHKSYDITLPGRFELYQNSPNPFNPSTEIRFDLSVPARVKLSVYNVLGQEVILLTDGPLPAGNHSVVWDGVDSSGQPVASGIYLYRIEAGNNIASRKMVLMK